MVKNTVWVHEANTCRLKPISIDPWIRPFNLLKILGYTDAASVILRYNEIVPVCFVIVSRTYGDKPIVFII